jgi:hypothetical protein
VSERVIFSAIIYGSMACPMNDHSAAHRRLPPPHRAAFNYSCLFDYYLSIWNI